MMTMFKRIKKIMYRVKRVNNYKFNEFLLIIITMIFLFNIAIFATVWSLCPKMKKKKSLHHPNFNVLASMV